MYHHTECYLDDPILSSVEIFKRDERPEKVNLSIGIYFDDEGKMPVLESVHRAEAECAAVPRPSPYLPMEGLDTYRSAVQRSPFGQDSRALAEGCVATIQALGGSGALEIGVDFSHRWFPEAKAYVGDSIWDSHKGIFGSAGLGVGTYSYYNPGTVSTKFEEMIVFFKTLPKNNVLILHPCCQNPTGVDMSQARWGEVLDIIKTHKLIPFMDIAYQGFDEDLNSDVYTIRRVVKMDLPLFVSNSFSKNLPLYGERVDGLSAVCPNKEGAELVSGQLKFTVRRICSSPTTHGTYIASGVMNSDDPRVLWKNEVYAMHDRVRAMRQKLYDVLMTRIPNRDFRHLIKQRGMFSYTGLTVEQVYYPRDEFIVYLLGSGRMCVTGLNASNIDYVTEAFAKVL